MAQHSDARLVTIVCAVKARDPAAMTELFQYTHQHLYYYAYMLTGDSHDAEDLLQEGYIKCIVAIDTLQNPGAFYSWMWTILKNIHQNQLRKQTVQLLSREQLEAEEKHLLDRILADDDTPEIHAEKRELSHILSHMIHALPPEQQEVILLHFYDGLTLSEIAKIQNCPVATVKSRLLYAKRSIRQAIQAEERRCGIALHASLPVPVLPAVFARAAEYIVLPVPTAVAIFTTVAGFFGITFAGDAVQLLGTTTTEQHPIRHKAIVVRIRLVPCAILALCLLLTVGVLAKDMVHILSQEPAQAVETTHAHDYPQSCLISAKGLENLTVHVGQTFAVQYFCLPYHASYQEVEVYSQNNEVARVEGKQITAVAPGETQIHFRNLHDPDKNCSMLLHVVDTPADTGPITSVVFHTDNLNNLLPGDVFSLNYSCIPYVADAAALYFTADDPAVAEYDGANLYARGTGITTIRCFRAADDTELGHITLQVYPEPASIPTVEPSSVIFYPTTRELQVDETLSLAYTCLPGTAAADSWYWEISDPAVLAFDGVHVTGLAAGESYIRIYRSADDVHLGQILYTVAP